MDDTHDGRSVPDEDEEGVAESSGEQSADEADTTAVVEELYDRVPFHQTLDLEVLVVTPRHAELKVAFDETLVGNPDLEVIHGGIISALIDVAGGAVFIGEQGEYTPTVDLRVNFLEAAGRQPLYATATVDRHGENIGVASVEVESGDAICATGTGVYKLSDS
jgi:uncharacterized protein (TIGR00369 family)